MAVARGGAEFGPRALGHRSFLAAAHRGELKERLNLGHSLGLNLCDLVTWLLVFYFLPHTKQAGAVIDRQGSQLGKSEYVCTEYRLYMSLA